MHFFRNGSSKGFTEQLRFEVLLLLIIVLIWTSDAQSFCTKLLHQSMVARYLCHD